jgi:hypothetical protein
MRRKTKDDEEIGEVKVTKTEDGVGEGKVKGNMRRKREDDEGMRK